MKTAFIIAAFVPDSCDLNNGGCTHYCNDTQKEVTCSCPSGYNLLAGKICEGLF